MGKIVEKKRKKKKGRPSLLDLQKRNLKLQEKQLQKFQKNITTTKIKKNPNFQNPSPNSSATVRRSTRRNPNPNSDADDEPPQPQQRSSSGKKRQKKLNNLVPRKLRNDEVKQEVDDDDDDVDEEELHSNEEESKNENDKIDKNSDDDELSSGSNLRKRKIDSISRGSTIDENLKGEKKGVVVAATKQEGCKVDDDDDGPSTRLPDKSLLLFILDRLQKKDTYGVFAEPVDPEELPDYHEVIDNPMDFSTVRKKLADGAYVDLEQFEKDVFLICSNAMQYNAPDTIYFRQARSIQELAKRNFDNLRSDSDDNEPDPEPKVVRRGRPPTKNLKRPPGRPPLERANSDFSEATLATPGGTTYRSNNELRKASHLEKHGSTDSYMRSLYGSRSGEAYTGWSAERYERADDTTGSASKGILMKHGKKHIVLDESRRNTYKHSYSLASGQEPSVLATFDRERKQLIAVGLHTEYGYARSLARFAAKIGPAAWKVASKKIEKCLPAGVKFGPGWVGENEAPAERPVQQSPTAVSQQTPPSSLPPPADTAPTAPDQGIAYSCRDGSVQKPEGEQLSETNKPCIRSNSNEESSKVISPTAAGNDATTATPSVLPSAGPNLTAPEPSASSPSSTMVNKLNNGTCSMRQGNPYQQIHQNSAVQSRINGLNGSYGLNFAAQMGKMIGAGRPTMFNCQSNPSIVTVSRTETQCLQSPGSMDNNGCEEVKLGNSSTIKPNDGLPNTGSNQNVGSTPPDLNVGFQSPGSPVSGKADSVQPDLALQL